VPYQLEIKYSLITKYLQIFENFTAPILQNQTYPIFPIIF